MSKPGEPTRSVLMRQLFYLLGRSQENVPDRHTWASDILRPRTIESFSTLTNDDLQTLIVHLVKTPGETNTCRSNGPGSSACIYNWPGHPLFCVNANGIEWLPREV